ncbi:MAG: chemotaxis protein CheW [Deltaproteobacteria bacterium]|nr:chemotaxis protein CheW [Deltaproteobacteria bacterium]
MNADNQQIACFKVADGIYGLDIMGITEIIRYQKILPLPKALDFIEGVINLREEAIPIISMRKRFGLEPIAETKATRIIIIKLGRKDVGIVVDSVDNVLNLKEGELKPPPSVTTAIEIEYLSGVIWDNDELVMVLDMDKVLSGREKITLAEVGAGKEKPGEEKIDEEKTAL